MSYANFTLSSSLQIPSKHLSEEREKEEISRGEIDNFQSKWFYNIEFCSKDVFYISYSTLPNI